MPNVFARGEYYGKDSPHRAFYDSTQKDDYIAYMDKGIKSTVGIDYLDYAGNEEKSSGIFNALGTLTKADRKALREKLRATDSIIWDMVISFEENYGEQNVYNANQARELLCKVLPKFFRQAGFKPENITWYAGLHTNTDNQHIHLSFFENEPMWYHHKSKQYRYRWKGKIQLECFDALKMDIEKYYLQPIEGIKRVRKLLTDDSKTITDNRYGLSRSNVLKSLIRKLYEEIPYTGKIVYESPNMLHCKDTVNAIVSLILIKGEHRQEYKTLMENIAQRDKQIIDLCETHKIKDMENHLYGDKFQKDLYRRMGNIVIKEVLKKRREELLRAKEFRHAKAQQYHHNQSLAECLLKTVEIIAYADQEAVDYFQEYREKLERIEIERKLQEME